METLVRIHDLSQQEKEAMATQAAYWTHSLVDHDDPSGGGSAIPVMIGSRCFLATAAHVICSNHRMELVRREGGEAVTDFTRKCFDLQSDVGALELDADNAAKISDFVPENQILVEFDQEEKWAVFATGSPGEAYLQMPLSRIGKISNIVTTSTVPRAEWPDDDYLEEPTDVGNDLFVEYPEDMDVSIFWPDKVRTESGLAPSKPPHPRGMSGGGIWVLSSAERKVWQPYVRLVGLVVGHLEKSQLLCGIRIGKWLDLIADNYPDLQESISSIVKRN